MKVTAYLVLDNGARGVRVARATQRRGYLDPNEAVLRIELNLPDDFFVGPVVTIEVPAEKIAVAVEALDPVEDAS